MASISEPKRAMGWIKVALDSSRHPLGVCKILSTLHLAGGSYAAVNAGGFRGLNLGSPWAQRIGVGGFPRGLCPWTCLQNLVRFSPLVREPQVSDGEKKKKIKKPNALCFRCPYLGPPWPQRTVVGGVGQRLSP